MKIIVDHLPLKPKECLFGSETFIGSRRYTACILQGGKICEYVDACPCLRRATSTALSD